MTTSLRTRVLAAILLVAMLSSGLSAALAWTYVRNTQVEAERAETIDALVVQRVALDYLMDVGTGSTNWDGLASAVQAAAASVGARVVVFDQNSGRVLADSDPSGPPPDSSDIDAIVNPGFALVAYVRNDGTVPQDGTVRCVGDCYSTTVDGFSPPIDVTVYYESDVPRLGFDGPSTMLAVAAVIAMSGLLALLVARRISHPIDALSASARELGSGNLDERFSAPSGSREVAGLADAFNTMADGLQRSEKARADLIADVAHELRNPIGTIVGNLEAAQDGVFQIDRVLIDRLHVEAVHLSRLTDDLQQMALADAGALSLQRQPVDLRSLLTETVATFEPLATTHGITVSVDVGEPINANVDPMRIRQVVSNLVKNAITYTPSGGAVQVSAAQDGHNTTIHVEDNGVGMTDAEQAKVFDRFWRADESRTRATGGTGVGLSVCRALVDAHNGTITVASKPGDGSCFTVTIPR